MFKWTILTAVQYREAHEEVELPLDSPDIHTIALLEPYISLYRIIVTPVIAVLTRPSLLDQLKAAENEVACIFTHPLRAIWDPSLARSEPLVAPGEDWPYDTELHVRYFYPTVDPIHTILRPFRTQQTLSFRY
jgi:coenzyme A diphosphatase NUDT7